MFAVLAFLSLASVAWPIARLWRATSRTALRSTCVWTAVAAGLLTITSGASVVEPEPGSWRWLALLRLVTTSVALMPAVAVLGARRPGEAAWNLVVLTLLGVFTLPVVQQWVLARPLETDRFGVDAPQLTLCAIIALVAVINYLPTRYGWASVMYGGAVAVQLAAIGPWRVSSPAVASILSSVSGTMMAATAWIALALGRRDSSDELGGAWLRLRDGWGLVWSLRFSDRWNAAARHYGWNLRLTWKGFEPREPGSPPPSDRELEAATDQFAILVRRFADPAQFLSQRSPLSEAHVATGGGDRLNR